MPYLIFKTAEQETCVCEYCSHIVHTTYVHGKEFKDFIGNIITDIHITIAWWKIWFAYMSKEETALVKLYKAIGLHQHFEVQLFRYEDLVPVVITPGRILGTIVVLNTVQQGS